MNLLLIILATVTFAIVAGFLSQYYKSKVIQTTSIIISILFILSFYYFLSASLFNSGVFIPRKSPQIYAPVGNYYNLVLLAMVEKKLHIADSSTFPILKDDNIHENFVHYWKQNIKLVALADTCCYKSKIYLYFGISPVLFFYAPFHTITGFFLTDKSLVFVISGLFFILSLLIIKILTQKIIVKKIPVYLQILTVFFIGFCNYTPFLLMKVASYEVAMMSAAFFLFLSLYLFFIYFIQSKTSYFSIFIISLLIAISVGCRPHYILFIPLLILAIIIIERFKGTNITNILKLLLVFSIPCILYGTILAAYNYLRFDSIFEFGVTYQLNHLRLIHHNFQIHDLLIGIKYYFFQPLIINDSFPFFSLVFAQGHSLNNQFISGVLYTSPIILFILLFPYVIYNLRQTNKITSIFLIILFFIAAINQTIAISLAGIEQRYMFEFMYTIILVSIFVFYYFLYIYEKSTFIKYLLNIIFILIYIFMTYINISLLLCREHSLQHRSYEVTSIKNYEKTIRFLS